MSITEHPTSGSTEDLQSENERLRARVASLEAELTETQARTNAIVAQTQERVYWLDRWHLDLNALMRRPGAAELRAALRAIRAVSRLATRARRRLRS
jgi:signal transduction protein with GAF and PtsI domain